MYMLIALDFLSQNRGVWRPKFLEADSTKWGKGKVDYGKKKELPNDIRSVGQPGVLPPPPYPMDQPHCLASCPRGNQESLNKS